MADIYMRVHATERCTGKYNCAKCGHLPDTHVLEFIQEAPNLLTLTVCRVKECKCKLYTRRQRQRPQQRQQHKEYTNEVATVHSRNSHSPSDPGAIHRTGRDKDNRHTSRLHGSGPSSSYTPTVVTYESPNEG